MSRIGKKPIKIPSDVSIDVKDNTVTAKGVKGELSYTLRSDISVKVENDELIFETSSNEKDTSAHWGLSRALVANMIIGVSKGFEKKLELVGVGYRVKSETPDKISMTLGYSHPIVYEAPKGVEFEVAEDKNIVIKGFDKQLVGQVAAEIRKLRKPEPYKGKGIKYIDEVVRRKPGKTGKV